MSPNVPLPPILAQAITRSQQAQTQLLKPKPRLAAAEANCQNQNIPAIAIAPSQGQHLALLCQLLGAQHVLEIGTLGGYSTIWLAESVPGIHVTSIEFSAKHRDIALENTKGMGNVEIRLGAAEEVMGELGREGRVFDFVFVDANWDQQALNLLDIPEEGDEADWSLVEFVRGDERVTATLIPTVSTHKVDVGALVDGFVLARVK
ncbi:hypothetical protein LTS16_008633 [Friedmanniomyces endolithicus]|nr:hypothetical protein LTR38_016112 [Friedmanniomyces endolithicus]KAK0796815.1 hypothetical protein LTR59_006956 [Friedmanniomyces endolithicus]KAK0885148.1 hypothetical protein LTR87_001177 [Friedmanniomyces endolithicus]KAK1042651.1 hypothetical protein LTS16_008633 [Friedmanniomyces endolithicus]